MTVNAADDIQSKLPGVAHQKTAALMNVYIANTTETLNKFAVVCERKVHDVDRRLERVSINMSQLEAKVDSAVASHGTQALRDAADGEAHAALAHSGDPAGEAPPSLAATVRSEYVEEIDVAGYAHAQQKPSRASSTGS